MCQVRVSYNVTWKIVVIFSVIQIVKALRAYSSKHHYPEKGRDYILRHNARKTSSFLTAHMLYARKVASIAIDSQLRRWQIYVAFLHRGPKA